ncbi:MAG: hypothetical protein K8S00_06900 [Bacteroidales bacterium]|nr:hypothetical protein [Bacteroidales bacterium]
MNKEIDIISFIGFLTKKYFKQFIIVCVSAFILGGLNFYLTKNDYRLQLIYSSENADKEVLNFHFEQLNLQLAQNDQSGLPAIFSEISKVEIDTNSNLLHIDLLLRKKQINDSLTSKFSDYINNLKFIVRTHKSLMIEYKQTLKFINEQIKIQNYNNAEEEASTKSSVILFSNNDNPYLDLFEKKIKIEQFMSNDRLIKNYNENYYIVKEKSIIIFWLLPAFLIILIYMSIIFIVGVRIIDK